MEKYNAAVILSYKSNEDTLKLAEAFHAMECVDKFVVADNSPGDNGLDGSENVLKSPKAAFIKIENQGYSCGNDQAIRMLEQNVGLPEYIIISNPDVVIPEQSVKACIDFLDSHIDFAVAAPQELKSNGEMHHLTGWKERTLLCDVAYSSGILSRIIGMYREMYPPAHWSTFYSVVDCVSGSFFVIRGTAFREVGYFDENTFLFYEEDILGYKLKRLGLKEAILNQYRFVHYEGISVGRNVNYVKKYLAMQKSRIYFHRVYKKCPFYKMTALYAATCLGLAENILKTVVKFRFIGKAN